MNDRNQGQERRGEVRLKSLNLINYSSVQQPGHPDEQTAYEVLGTARTSDISASGCRIHSTEPVPDGMKLTFDLQLGDYIVHCTGRVMRVSEVDGEHVAGVEFDDLDETARDGIRLYLEFKESPEEA